MMPLEERNLGVWQGVNIEVLSREPPKHEETRLALYLVDIKKGTFKEFRHINKAVRALADREISEVAYGSKGEDTVFKVVVKWEKP